MPSGRASYQYLCRFIADERGATAIEYGLIAALLAVVICGAVSILGTKIYAKFATVQNSM